MNTNLAPGTSVPKGLGLDIANASTPTCKRVVQFLAGHAKDQD